MPPTSATDPLATAAPELRLPVGLHLVGAGAEGRRWLGALSETGVAFRASESADVAGLAPALRDPLDLVLVWDDPAGERALAALAAVAAEGMGVAVAAVGHPEAEGSGHAVLEAGAAAVLARERPERLPATVERVLRAVRLEARAELTGRIAHDLNNLLAPIPLALQLLRRAAERPPAAGTLDAIDLASRGSMAAVRELSELIAAPPEASARIRAKHLVALAARHWRRPPAASAAGTAGAIADYPPDLAQVRVDPVRMLQVLACLARRSLDAAGEGELHFRGRNLEAGPEPGAGRAAVELRVLCGASGAEPAGAPSAPADGQATIRAMVEAHGGGLRALATSPEGRAFTVTLPAAPARGAPPGSRRI